MPPRYLSGARRTRQARAIVGAALLALGVGFGSPGCELVAVPFAGFEDYTVPAAYELPHRSTVLIVEPRSRAAEDERFARQIAARAHVQLDRNLVNPAKPGKPVPPTSDEPGLSMVSAAEVARFQDRRGEAYYHLSIEALGRELNVDTVIYAKVIKARLNDQGSVLQPESRVSVRVIDARTGRRLWPETTPGMEGAATGWPIETGGTHQTTSAGELSPTMRDRAWQALADDVGLDLARLFYAWERPQPGAAAEAEKRRVERQKRSNEAVLR
ncbi:MAG: hypothetical protein AAGE65_07665 [Planctomycetota bacterium]